MEREKARYISVFVCGLLAVAALMPVGVLAQGFTVHPHRIVFEGRERKARAIISNQSDKQETYRVQLLKRRMKPDGSYEDIVDPLPGEQFADRLVRFSPRSFTLAPNSAQTIRLQLRKPRTLADGEYRSHLRVQLVPEAAAPKLPEEGKLGIQIQVNYGVTIPVIVRQGALDYQVAIHGMKLEGGTKKPTLNATFTRKGARSAYGDISATFTDAKGAEHVLNYLPGLSIFVPNDTRDFRIPLDIPKGVRLKGGTLTLTYRTPKDEGGELIAQADMKV